MANFADRDAVLQFARVELAKGIRDIERDFGAIQRYYEATGWRGPRDRAGETYEGNFAWCGAFAGAAHAAREVGTMCVEPLDRAQRVKMLSTYRLHTQAQGRKIPLVEVQPGDVLVVGKEKAYGDHIAIVMDRIPQAWITIEGNAVGGQVGATRVEGVVCRVRGLGEAVCAYRFWR